MRVKSGINEIAVDRSIVEIFGCISGNCWRMHSEGLQVFVQRVGFELCSSPVIKFTQSYIVQSI
jgi:hypothetical protein